MHCTIVLLELLSLWYKRGRKSLASQPAFSSSVLKGGDNRMAHFFMVCRFAFIFPPCFSFKSWVTQTAVSAEPGWAGAEQRPA